MRILLTLTAAAVLLTATVGAAQYNPSGWVIQTNNSTAALATVDPAGKLATLVTSRAWPASSMGHGVTMDIDNKTYLISLLTKGLKASILQVAQSGQIVGTIAVLPKPPSSGGDFVYDIAMDQDGDYVALVSPGGGSTRGLVKITRAGSSRIAIYTGLPLANPVGLTVDVETGDFIVLDNAFGASRLWRIGQNGKRIATLASLPQQSYGSQVAQLAATGDYYVPGLSFSSRTGAGVFKVTQSGAITTFLGRAGNPTVYGIAVGRSSPIFPNVALSMVSPQTGVFLVDALTQTATTLISLSGNQMYGIAQNRGRNVATQKLAAGKWAVTMSFPGEAGNGYLAALSLSGTRPGFPLPDRRHVSLNLDKLTELSLNGSLFAIFRGNIGALNTQAEAQAVLDISQLSGLSGIRIWIQVLTQSPNAPNGIQTVADPITLLL